MIDISPTFQFIICGFRAVPLRRSSGKAARLRGGLYGGADTEEGAREEHEQRGEDPPHGREVGGAE